MEWEVEDAEDHACDVVEGERWWVEVFAWRKGRWRYLEDGHLLKAILGLIESE